MRLLLLIAGILSPQAHAASPAFTPAFSGCGLYEIKGRIAFLDQHYFLMVHAKSNSETRLALQPAAMFKAAAHSGKPVLVRGEIDAPVQTYRGKIRVTKIDSRVPDPLRPENDSGFRLLAPHPCAPSGP